MTQEIISFENLNYTWEDIKGKRCLVPYKSAEEYLIEELKLNGNLFGTISSLINRMFKITTSYGEVIFITDFVNHLINIIYAPGTLCEFQTVASIPWTKQPENIIKALRENKTFDLKVEKR